jgi:hypothetical protein
MRFQKRARVDAALQYVSGKDLRKKSFFEFCVFWATLVYRNED